MTVDFAGFTTRGPRRAENQDVIGFTEFTSAGEMSSPLSVQLSSDAGAAIVVDGMGGQAGGATAAGQVARRLAAAATEIHSADAIRVQTHDAARDLHSAATIDSSLATMGATFAAVSWTRHSVSVFHVGDSRVYGLFGEVFRRLTDDDRVSADSNVLSKSVGGTLKLELPNPTVRHFERGNTARFLLCTDGLSDVVPFESIEAITRTRSNSQACIDLVRQAWPTADDNISVVVLDIKATPLPEQDDALAGTELQAVGADAHEVRSRGERSSPVAEVGQHGQRRRFWRTGEKP